MSGYTALNRVSTTLKTLLDDRLDTGVDVTIAPPDAPAGAHPQRVNLYLYEVLEEAHLKNQEIPGEGYPAAYGHPPLSLRLHYLVTAFGGSGDTADANAQEYLGDAMRVLHDFPVITPDLRVKQNPAHPPILASDLLGEFEQIKITLLPSGLDELSKIWTAHPTVNYRRSVAYEVSVVQIESQRTRTQALPVKRRLVYAIPLQTPQIAEVFRQPPYYDETRTAAAEIGETIRIVGTNLAAGSGRTLVRIGDLSPISVSAPLNDRIDVAVPSTLTIGVHPVQVVHELDLGDPAQPHQGFQSNVAALLVIPRATSVPTGPLAAGAQIGATIAPDILSTQSVELLLDDRAIPAMPPVPGSPSTPNVTFDLPTDLGPKTYLRRIRVSGAETRLKPDYSGPTLEIA